MKITWHRYYYRLIGILMVGTGVGFLVEQAYTGPQKLSPTDHALWGIALIALGAYFTTRPQPPK